MALARLGSGLSIRELEEAPVSTGLSYVEVGKELLDIHSGSIANGIAKALGEE